MKKLFLILIISVLSYCAFGQVLDSSETEKSKKTRSIYYNPGFGLNNHVTNLSTGEITDYLINYSDKSGYIQAMSFTFVFYKNFGLELTTHWLIPKGKIGRDEDLYDYITDKYEMNYTISFGVEQFVSYFPVQGARYYGGIVYRMETPKIILMPKLLLGYTRFDTNSCQVTLDDRNSRNVITIDYSTKGYVKQIFTYAPTLTFAYRISKQYLIKADLQYSFFKSDFEYKIQTFNRFANETTIEKIDYKNGINTFSFGFGLIYEFDTSWLEDQFSIDD